MNTFHQINMPQIICGRGSISFVTTLGKKKIAVLGYHNCVKDMSINIFHDCDVSIRYVATIDHEPLIEDIYNNLDTLYEFEPDMILAIGGGSVMDVAKGLHLFYENKDLSFADSLKPFTLPKLGKKAVSVYVPTTSGTGSEASSAAVFIDQETQTKKLLLSNTLIPHYAVLDPDFTDALPDKIRIATGLDALCHAVESLTAKNANTFTKSIACESALDIIEYLPKSIGLHATEEEKNAQEIVHTAASLAGIAITNSFTGIVHSYDHPGPAFHLPHGIVCGIMLPYSMKLVGSCPAYSMLAKRLGYTGTDTELSEQLIQHIKGLVSVLKCPGAFCETDIDKTTYFANVPEWSKLSLSALATQMSPANMDYEKGLLFYSMCYYGIL